MAEKLERLLKTFTPIVGQDNNETILLGGRWHELWIAFSGDLVVGVAAATLVEDGILKLIKKIEINTNLGFTLKTFNGAFAHKREKYELGTEPQIAQPAIAVGTNPFSILVKLAFDTRWAAIPEVTAFFSKLLKGAELQNVTLNLKLGVATDVATAGGGGSVALAALTARITLIEDSGSPAEFAERPLNIETQVFNRKAFDGTDQGVELKTKRELKRIAFLIETAANLLSDTAVDEIRLEANGGTKILRKWKFTDLQRANKDFYGLETTEKGFAIAELDKKGNFSRDDIINAANFEDLSLVFNTNVDSRISVELQEVL